MNKLILSEGLDEKKLEEYDKKSKKNTRIIKEYLKQKKDIQKFLNCMSIIFSE